MRLARLAALAAAPLAPLALTAATAPQAARHPVVALADTARTSFAGAWTLTAHRTPVGTFTAALVVAAGETGSTLSIPALGIARLDLATLTPRGDTLDVPAAFFASPPGDHLSTTLRLVRTADGVLDGTWTVAGSDGSDVGTFRVTGVRAGG